MMALRRADWMFLGLAITTGLPAACSATGDRTETATTSGTSGSGGNTGASSGPTGGTGGSGGLGLPDGGNSNMGCTAVDILFIIDNSGSMCHYQTQLSQAFPSFIDAIDAALPPATDLHVGITTSSFDATMQKAHNENMCVPDQPESELEGIFKSPTTNMTTTNGYQGRLLEWNGQKFSSATTGDATSVQAMKSWFGGAAVSVGCMGNAVEFLAAGAGYAAHSVNHPINAGFFRDEGTVLLIFTLTDEHDHSPAPLTQYHDMLTSIKSGCGGDTCIITGGLLNPSCATGGKKIWDFLNMFGEPTKWAPIADDAEYTKVLAEALAPVVKQTCDEIEPPK